MTDTEKIAYLAEKIMGWENHPEQSSVQWLSDKGFWIGKGSWDPLTDWGHWRMVEMKVMQTPELNQKFLEAFGGNNNEEAIQCYIETDLPKRAETLLSALSA